MNLILIKELNQDKDNMEQLKNVLVKLIIQNMLLNMLNKEKDKLILLKYKQDNN